MAIRHISALPFLSPLTSPVLRQSQRWSTIYQRAVLLQGLPVLSGYIANEIPSFLAGLWESVLRAVPKKKTSHMKKRHRQMAGKALKDVKSLSKCPGCGETKRSHVLCPTCVKAHPIDIFSLAVTYNQIISASGASALKVHSTADPDFPLVQTIEAAHKIGCHHVVTSRNGLKAASIGFAGEIKIWINNNGEWSEETALSNSIKDPEAWAICLSEDGRYLAGTTHDGHIKVWDLNNKGEQFRDYETKGAFGACLDMSIDGKYIASGHQNGSIYMFNNETGRMPFSLSGLVKPVRTVAFSPGGKLLAAAGDAKVIVLYDTESGEQVTQLTGHSAWILSLDWSHTGEYLLSGSFDGKIKVWSIERRACVATHSENEKAVWSVKWLPKIGRTEGFATAGASRSISFYREATGG
ncbi:meiotic recombination protein Ski8/Rec14, putative [Talaromyces stipitatus ATCC 10500]|uniref:Meiotic recombination protein Ski8/Rec14, putative n=1 Tax=Talaromyces stipitatus (strain ATCC 10500 / CBS 375.48 / QM 6759 / NRRL 1006) TaxID=441959 RepID=B8M792_TALSN|nr:meiotic recombination protein Ski8/Rec14, putative [Talaromyces stipitatus ATCC 10500]EED20312.1 meiotic recombination protein Ski8/Rec14, putative [Talaromyces stipitatus ATCC 10500]